MTNGASTPPPPPPPVWMPVASSSAPMNYWPLLAFWGRAIGFFLLFLGALIIAVFENSPSDIVNAIVASNIIWVVGLAMMGGAAGLNLHWNLQRPRGAGPEEANALVWDRRLNGLLLIVSIILLFVVMLTASFLR